MNVLDKRQGRLLREKIYKIGISFLCYLPHPFPFFVDATAYFDQIAMTLRTKLHPLTQ